MHILASSRSYRWGVFVALILARAPMLAGAPAAGDSAQPAVTVPTSPSAPVATATTATAVRSEPTSPSKYAAPPPLFASGAGKRYVVVKINSPMMSRHGTVVLKRGIDFAVKKQAALVAVELETPGGLVTVMLGMRDALIDCPVPTVSFIRQAYSAGSLLALATDRIYMHPIAHIGDAIPIQLTLGQPQEISGDMKEKILAPMRKEFTTTARHKGHREDLALAMVDRDAEIPGLNKKGEILVLDAPTAVREGLAVKIVHSVEEAVADTGLVGGERLEYRVTAADKLASFLSTPVANILLIAIAIGGIYVEVKTPGFGLGGITAIAALFMFFWANWYANMAHWLEILLFLAGVGLIIGELAVPGFGILGISGIACVLASIFLAMFRLPPTGFEFDYSRIAAPARNLAWALVFGLIGLLAVGEAIRHTRLWQRLTLGGEMASGKGFTGLPDLSNLVGREATVLTDLRPVGTVRVGKQRLDAMTRGDFVTHGARVKIIGVDAGQVVVEAEEEGPSASSSIRER